MIPFVELNSHHNDKLPPFIGAMLLSSWEDILRSCYNEAPVIEQLTSRSHSPYYANALVDLWQQFQRQIEVSLLPVHFGDWWRYTYEVGIWGASLILEHIGSLLIDENLIISDDVTNIDKVWEMDLGIDQRYTLIHVPPKMLTVEEYSELYHVEPVTVRQWIRRNKLRAVKKTGNEWRISSLSDTPVPGKDTAFHWRGVLANPPSSFSYINDYKHVSFERSDRRGTTIARFQNNSWPIQEKTVPITQMERVILESYLQENTEAQYDPNQFRVCRKKLPNSKGR